MADVEISINILVGSQFDDLKFLNLCMAVVSDESSDDDAGDVEDLREVAKVEDFENFDPRFSKKRFTRLKEVDRKLLSAVLHLSKTELKQKKSNASLTYDRKQWLISCRGLHGLVFNARRNAEVQDEALETMLQMYKMSQYYKFAKVVPKVFSVGAVRKYALHHHTDVGRQQSFRPKRKWEKNKKGYDSDEHDSGSDSAAAGNYTRKTQTLK